MWSIPDLPPRHKAPAPFVAPREATVFLRWYLALFALIVVNALAAALWPADSITTSSRTTTAGSSSTACPASTPGSSR